MTLEQIVQILSFLWPIIVAVAVIIFDWGVLWTRMKTFVTKEKLKDEIEKILVGHCPFEQPMRNLEVEILSLKQWKEQHEGWGLKMNEQNHLLLQEIVINLKLVCKKLEMDYTAGKINGN